MINQVKLAVIIIMLFGSPILFVFLGYRGAIKRWKLRWTTTAILVIAAIEITYVYLAPW